MHTCGIYTVAIAIKHVGVACAALQSMSELLKSVGPLINRSLLLRDICHRGRGVLRTRNATFFFMLLATCTAWYGALKESAGGEQKNTAKMASAPL